VVITTKRPKTGEDRPETTSLNFAVTLPKRNNVLREMLVFILIQELKSSTTQTNTEPNFVKRKWRTSANMANTVPSLIVMKKLRLTSLTSSNKTQTFTVSTTKPFGVHIQNKIMKKTIVCLLTTGRTLDENHTFTFTPRRSAKIGT